MRFLVMSSADKADIKAWNKFIKTSSGRFEVLIILGVLSPKHLRELLVAHGENMILAFDYKDKDGNSIYGENLKEYRVRNLASNVVCLNNIARDDSNNANLSSLDDRDIKKIETFSNNKIASTLNTIFRTGALFTNINPIEGNNTVYTANEKFYLNVNTKPTYFFYPEDGDCELVMSSCAERNNVILAGIVGAVIFNNKTFELDTIF